ncbi:MAG: agmatine deiminase family protein [Candidatus Eremiobacterota bacterium]
MSTRLRTPRSLGFAMPAEWEPHAATWTAWPFDDEEWRGFVESARQEYAAVLTRLAECEPVELLVADEEAETDARRRLPGVRCHRVPLDDVWFRDNGPLFVRRPDGAVAMTHWRFNAWGEKYDFELDARAPEALERILTGHRFEVPVVLEGGSLDVNGRGLALTTRQCLLHPRRNPGWSEADLERVLLENLGIERLVWLERGLEGDHTDGHIDTLARFLNEGTVACCVAEDPADPNHAVLQDNLERLEAAGLDVVPVPLPAAPRYLLGERLPLTYVNFYVANGIVLVPTYGDVNDERALAILGPLFPGRSVEGFAASAILTSGGAFHCLTQQQPAGPMWRGE